MRELPDDYSRRVRDQLYHARPDDAQFYALASVGGGTNSGRRYPMSGSYLLCPENQFELPYGAPEGEYRVLFYRQQLDNAALPYRRTHPSFRLLIQWPGQGPMSAAHPESAAINPATKSVERDPALREAEIEFEKHKMAVAMQRDTHQLVRSAAHARDVGESYAVVSAYRQDSYLSAEAHGALNRRMIESTSKIQEIHVGLVQSIEPTILAVKRAAELLTVPPPPVDYTSVLAKTVEVVGILLTKLLERDSRHQAADDELRDGRKTRAMKQAQTECEPSRKPDKSQSDPPGTLMDNQQPPPDGRRSDTSRRPDDSRTGGPANQGLVTENIKPVEYQTKDLGDQEARFGLLGILAVAGATVKDEGRGTEAVEPTQAVLLGQPLVPKPPIDRLTDPQRPDLAAAVQEFLSQFKSEEERRAVLAALHQRILDAKSAGLKR